MVLRHFKLREQPFGVTPDPRYLFITRTHGEALSSLLYGLESGLGFVALTGPPGMGKTTLLFEALRRMEQTTKTVFLFQTIANPAELLRAVLMDLGITNLEGSPVDLQSRLNEALLSQYSQGRRVVLVIDEAQNLDESVLEAVRVLSNFETARHKLIQIVLSGQPQFAARLALPQLLQLRQRISIFAHLKPLSATETIAYVHHRLRVAGRELAESMFTDSALALIARQSEGVPRNINNICFNALSVSCALRRDTIDIDVVEEVVSDLDIQVIAGPGISPAVKSSPLAVLGSRRAATQRPSIRSSVLVSSLAIVFSAILFFFCARLLPEKPVSAGTSMQPNVSSLRHTTATVSDSIALPTPFSNPETTLVEVRKGQSLYHICVETFGHCRPAVFREILSMNAALRNPARLQPGQKVSIPNVLQPQSTLASARNAKSVPVPEETDRQ